MKPEDFVCLPRLVRDYLNYLSSVKGKSQLTVCEYASDLRLFFAYMLKQENFSQYKNTPIDEIDISKLDIDFISLARIPTAYGFLEYCRVEHANKEVYRLLRYGVKDKEALFLSNRKTRISPKTVQHIVDEYLEKSGLSGQGFSTHKLRHTAATLMYQYGHVDVLQLKEILGHENLATTEIYTHVVDEQLRSAVDSNPLNKVKINRKKSESDSDEN